MRRLFLLSGLLLLSAPASAWAQPGACTFSQGESGTFTRTEQNGGIISVSGGIVIRCAGGTTIRANEGNIFQAMGQTHLFGNVVFEDGTRRLTSNTAVYTSGNGRLHATGNAVFTDAATGSTLRGPDIEYYKVMPGRPQAQMIATQRPHLTLVPEARPGQQRPEPLEIDGNRITAVGENLYVSGQAVIQSTQMNATAGEARYDRATGRLELIGSARIRSDRFDLSGEQVDAIMPATGGIERLQARTNAVLKGEQLEVTAPDLQLFFSEERLQRLVGRRTAPELPQPVAASAEFQLQADSLDAVLPAQRLEQVIAIGHARGETIDTTAAGRAERARAAASAATDSTAIARSDWILGDTIVGFFAPRDSAATAADTAIVLKRIIAHGDAQSLYRLEVRDTTQRNPAAAPKRGLNYLAGEKIELTFQAGQLEVANVIGLQRGLYLDPTPPAATPPSETPAGETPPGATPEPTTPPATPAPAPETPRP